MKRSRRTPVIFVIGTSYLFLLISDTDTSTGTSGVGKKTLCALISQNFDFQHISLDDVSA